MTEEQTDTAERSRADVAPTEKGALPEDMDAQARQAERSGDRHMASTDIQQQDPMSEQELALEQWLRQVPDDPAGLLRRKFMLEHLLRQKRHQTP